jgi:glycine/D-amino acid oxidase-like deaminating enzyme
VVVVGGGPTGIMAASAAARAGQRTLLIERYGFLSGAGTAGGLSTFCGLHARTYGEDVRVIRGPADELLDRLVKLDGLNEPHLTIADGIAAQAFDMFRINGVDVAKAGPAPWRTVEHLMDEAEKQGTHTSRKKPIVRSRTS